MLQSHRSAHFVFAFCLVVFSKLHAQELHLVTAAMPPIAPSADKPGYMELIAREAFNRVGVKVTISSLPGERALLNANTGIDDGDLLRIPGLEKFYPNLIRVPEKVMDFEFVAFTKNPDIKVKTIAGLEPYTVAYVTGWKFYENRIKKAKNITQAPNLAALFQLLQKGRADIVLAERWQGLWAAKQEGIKVKHLHPPLKVSNMYMYLHKRHAALVPKVAEALANMKQDGSFQKIVASTLLALDDK